MNGYHLLKMGVDSRMIIFGTVDPTILRSISDLSPQIPKNSDRCRVRENEERNVHQTIDSDCDQPSSLKSTLCWADEPVDTEVPTVGQYIHEFTSPTINTSFTTAIKSGSHSLLENPGQPINRESKDRPVVRLDDRSRPNQSKSSESHSKNRHVSSNQTESRAARKLRELEARGVISQTRGHSRQKHARNRTSTGSSG